MMRQYETAAAVLQAQHRLRPAEHAGFEVDLRLVEQQKPVLLERLAQPVGDPPTLGDLAPCGAQAKAAGVNVINQTLTNQTLTNHTLANHTLANHTRPVFLGLAGLRQADRVNVRVRRI
jgi:hypothetical protein